MVDCHPELDSLQRNLKNYIGGYYRIEKNDEYWKFDIYHPHITIVSSSAELAKKASSELKNSDLRQFESFYINGVDLYIKNPKGWKKHTTFSFGRLI